MADWTWPNSYIAKVVDADSLDVVVTRKVSFDGAATFPGFTQDLGFEGCLAFPTFTHQVRLVGEASFPVRLRLNRINAARSSTDRGRRAKARVLALTAGARVDVTTMNGYKFGAPKEKTGEWMAEVTLPGGANLSDLLVVEGHAVYWDGQGPRPGDG